MQSRILRFPERQSPLVNRFSSDEQTTNDDQRSASADLPPSLDIAHYSVDQFKKDVESFKPRIFDSYILPAFMIYFAYKAKGMPRIARRMLFVSGIYMGYRNYSEYKKLVAAITGKITTAGQGNASTVEAKNV